MVKLQGPILSLEASGSIGGSLIVQQNKGRTYMRKLTAPKQPQAASQIGHRAMFAWLTKHWMNVSLPDQASWETQATFLTISTFDAYMRVNLKRWNIGKSPGEAWPVAEDDAAGSTTIITVSNQGRGLSIPFTLSPTEQNAATRLHRSLVSGFTPALENLIAVIQPPTAVPEIYLDAPLPPGTYYYKLVPFSDHGVTGTPSAQDSGTVT